MRQPVPFGKYLLLDRISVGGMAEVFKAKSYGVEGFEKIIAIKRILPTMGEDRDFIKMFIDEAKIAGQLAHANICQIFELGRIDGSHFIAMEYIWGKDLLQIQNRLRKIKTPMPIAMACFTIAKVLEGLDYAHRKRDPLGRPLEIVHRDCSPQNVLVSYEGEVKVIDFGIAKATSRNSRTMAGVLKGKFGYMSPEQVRGLPLDRRSDIFALGTMLYECLTGDRLFQGETDFSTLEKVRNVDIQNPRAINPNIPEAIERVILKALAKDVDDRYQWCSEMLADLQAFLMSEDVVFTAKSLSGWLKEVFSTEIDRERALLEQYKRVGRDGLIAGVPAAEAKVDVVETLGEAGVPEGDATQLGGPDFDDLEQAVAASASPEVGPAPGSPAARPQHVPDDDDEGDGDFGEEAPTEIFGELDNPPPAAPQPMAARPPTSGASRPPRPPPGARPSAQGVAMGPGMAGAPMSPPQQAASASAAMTMPIDNGGGGGGFAPAYGSAPAPAQPAYGAPSYPQQYPYQPQAQPGMSGPIPAATPNAMPSQPPPGAGPAKTLLGQNNPLAGNYGPNYRVTGQQPAYTPQGYPSQPQMQGYPSQPQMQGYPSQPQMQGYPSQPQMQGYGQAAPAIEHTAQQRPEAKKKSSIGRDVAIGIAIAAVVLGGFLAVKFLVLDDDGTSGKATTTSSSIATIKLSLPAGVSADLFVDDKKIGSFRDNNEVPVSAGSRKVKLVGPNDTKCEQEVDLPGGKTTPVQCALTGAEPAGSGSGAGSGAGSDAGSGSAAGSGGGGGSGSGGGSGGGSAAPASGSGAGSAKVETVTKPDEGTKPTDKVTTSPADKTTTKPADKPADKTTTKPADKPADKTTTKPADKTTTKPADKPADKTTTKPDKMAAKAKEGYLVVTSKPSGAKILVDNKPTGMTTPTGKISLTPGRHKVTFLIGEDKFTFAVNVKVGETLTLNKELQ